MSRLFVSAGKATKRHKRSLRFGVTRGLGLVAALSLGWQCWYVTTVLLSSRDGKGSGENIDHSLPSSAMQYVRYNKRGKEVMHRIHTVRLDDLRDLTDDYLVQLKRSNNQTLVSYQEASTGKHVLLQELHQSGISRMDLPTVQLLPTWSQVAQLYYQHAKPDTCEPIIFGMERCRAFATKHVTRQSFLATAGLYNTGTNALTYYLRANLRMKDNPLWDGILVQVPWHKHWFVHQRESHTIPYLSNVTLSTVLPIVTVRDPLSWAQSMCEQPYDVEWTQTGKVAPPQCPSLSQGDASVRLPKQKGETVYRDLFHLWNEWYSAYLEAAAGDHLDFVIVRHEDLLYCPRQVLSKLQECSGASWKHKDGSFVYVMDQAKWEHARLSGRAQSNRVSAMIKHGHGQARRRRHLTQGDFRPRLDKKTGKYVSIINETLLNLFSYRLPTHWNDWKS